MALRGVYKKSGIVDNPVAFIFTHLRHYAKQAFTKVVTFNQEIKKWPSP